MLLDRSADASCYANPLRHMDCPEENALVDFARGDLDSGVRDALEVHLDECALCREVMVELARFEPGSDELAITDDTRAPEPEALTRDPEPGIKVAPRLSEGDKVGRYVVLRRVGAGGMGVVYAAYDPELDRKVAIKLLMTSLGGSLAAEFREQRARLLREAQAMAKLSHPNVITVHDVGEYADQVFVAMEFIDGETLGDWAKRTHTWRETLQVYAAAGRGLGAAHRAGLVHRDFKPDNVLIGKDGRVLVTDFGLARPAAGKTDTFGTVSAMENTPVLTASLTRTGALVGTPAYMAPEQLAGKRSGALADQFSFCVAVYGAFYGQRPFEGRVLGELMASVSAGRVRMPPRDSGVPRSIRLALLRGLEVEPEDRFPTMEALLAKLDRDPARTRRRWAAVLLPSAVLTVSLATAQHFSSGQNDFCDDVTERLDGVWDDARARELHQAFAATGKPYAESVWEGAHVQLQQWADGWVDAQRDACEAASEGAQAQAVLALRMHCLDRHRRAFFTLIDVLAEIDGPAIERAQDTIAGLSPAKRCEDVDALARHDATLDSPEQRDRRRRLDELTARTELLRRAGKLEEAERHASDALEQAESASDRWSEATALVELAKLADLQGQPQVCEPYLHRAMSAALASDNQEVIVRVAIGMLWIASQPNEPTEDAERWYAHGLAALERIGGAPLRRVEIENALAAVFMWHGDFDRAEKHMQLALEVQREQLPDDDTNEDVTWSNLGQLYAGQGRMDDALQAFERAVMVVEGRYGSNHPYLAAPLENLGAVRGARREYDEAISVLTRSLALRRASLGDMHPQNANSLLNLSNVDRHLGNYEQAQARLVEAVEIVRASRPGSPLEAEMLMRLGRTRRTAGKLQEALADHRKALALIEARSEVPPLEIARYEIALGRTLVFTAQHDEARGLLSRALERHQKSGEDDLNHARSLLWWATSYPQGVPDDRRAQVEAAGKLASSVDDPLRRADALQTWAEVTWASGDHDAARGHALAAQEVLVAVKSEGTTPLKRTLKWLAAHPEE